MNAIKLFFLFFLALPFISCAKSKDVSLLIPEETRKILLESNSILATELQTMLMRPIAFPDNQPDGDTRILSKKEKEVLLKHLLASNVEQPNDRFKECKYRPGVKFSFYNYTLKDIESNNIKNPEVYKQRIEKALNMPKPLFEVLLCFNCSVWAVSGNSNLSYGSNLDSNKVKTFGEINSGKEELKSLFYKLFPKNAGLSSFLR